MQPITIGNFDYSQDEKGNWIYKAKDFVPLKKEKPKYQEKPQYKLQEKIEQQSKSRFNKIMNLSVIEVMKFLNNNL